MPDELFFDSENSKKLIFDETNVSETNPLKDLFQISVKLVLILTSLYFSIFFVSGIIIKTLSVEKQIQLENLFSDSMNISTVSLPKEEVDRLERIKANILDIDSDFPNTSTLQISVIEDKYLNALCYPNGTIYITSELYKRLKTDEQLTFIIAHEMAHYRNRDHLMSLRKNIAGGVIIILLSISSIYGEETSTIVDGMISLTDLKYSRNIEQKADIYAGKMLLSLYNSTLGGKEVLEILRNNSELYELEVFSTHPIIKSRIKILEDLK